MYKKEIPLLYSVLDNLERDLHISEFIDYKRKVVGSPGIYSGFLYKEAPSKVKRIGPKFVIKTLGGSKTTYQEHFKLLMEIIHEICHIAEAKEFLDTHNFGLDEINPYSYKAICMEKRVISMQASILKHYGIDLNQIQYLSYFNIIITSTAFYYDRYFDYANLNKFFNKKYGFKTFCKKIDSKFKYYRSLSPIK